MDPVLAEGALQDWSQACQALFTAPQTLTSVGGLVGLKPGGRKEAPSY